MKRHSRLVLVLTALALAAAVLTGCNGGAGGASADGAKAVALDTSKAETLNFVLLGPEPKDMAKVSAELNKLTQRDFNMSVNWIFLGWDKWNDKYNLKLTSGEQVDLVYTANWADYLIYARRGVYLPLDDLAPKYMPVSWKNMSQDKWTSAKVGGKMYTVPCDWEELKSDGILYRQDLAEKYGVKTPILSWDEMAAYLDACLKNNPNVIPFNETSEKIKDATLTGGLMKYETPVSAGVYYAVAQDNNTPKVLDFYETPEFESFAGIMKQWYEKGYWSKSVLSNKTEGSTLFDEGKTFACKGNITAADQKGIVWAKDHPEWKVGIFLESDVKGVIHPNAAIGNGVALAKACIDPARALAFLDKLRNDKDYYQLTQYGIKGEHWDTDQTGAVTFKGAADQVGFGESAMQPWGWHVDAMELKRPTQWPGLQVIKDRVKPFNTANKYDSFAFDPQPVAAQYAALEQVRNQYIAPLIVGKSKDVKADIKLITEKLKAAGVDAYLAEVQKQLDAYWKEMGY